jgi:proteasome lid subunit RPN8/RPN11
VILHQALVDELREHAGREFPREACGVLVGPANGSSETLRLVRMTNTADSDSEYAFDPDEQITLWQEVEDADHQVRVIYHSHPRSRARPSKVDLATASYPDVIYLIIGSRGQLGAWWIEDGQATELPVEIRPAGCT